MADDHDLEKLLAICNRWPPPEVPIRVDLRATDYSLSLPIIDRLERNGSYLQINELMSLADGEALQRAIEVLRASAQQNRYWNGGIPVMWPPDAAVTEAAR
jgi:hypothetical protein